MGNKESEIYQLIEPICQSEDIYLSDVSLHGSSKNTIIKIIVDTENGVTLNQCQELSKKISDIFYRRDLFQNKYRLEVSSPGITKPLEHSYEFKRNIGKQLEVNYIKGEEKCFVTGELLKYTPDAITLKSDKTDLDIPLNDIEEAKIKLKW